MNSVEILELMVEDYKSLDGVTAIVLGGSSTAKTSDDRSDFDIYIYTDKEPDVAKRAEIAAKYADYYEVDNHYFETGDVYTLRETGKPIDIMYRSPEWIEDCIKRVWEEGCASMGYTTCFVDNVKNSKILFDKNDWFKNLQKSLDAPYPDKLADNIIKKNFTFLKDAMYSYFDQLASAVKRNDYVSINHRIAAFLASYFDTLFALNRVLNPGEKKLVEFAKNNCKILPDNFEADVNGLVISLPDEKLSYAERLVANLRRLL